MEKSKNKKIKKLLIAIGIIILLIIAGFFCLANALRTKTYATLEEFQKNMEKPLYYEIPQTATDCRFAIRKPLLSRQFLYAFTLEEAEYQEYIKKLIEQYHLESQDERDRNYSYAHWYGMKVADCHNDFQLDDFPVTLPFEAVSDTPIGEYTIIVYSPTNTGSKSHALVAIPEEHRIVCYQAYFGR